MAGCTYGIGSVPRKTKQRSVKSLQTTFLSYSTAKSTPLVPLTFIKFKKTKRENFNFVYLRSSYSFFSIMQSSKTI